MLSCYDGHLRRDAHIVTDCELPPSVDAAASIDPCIRADRYTHSPDLPGPEEPEVAVEVYGRAFTHPHAQRSVPCQSDPITGHMIDHVVCQIVDYTNAGKP